MTNTLLNPAGYLELRDLMISSRILNTGETKPVAAQQIDNYLQPKAKIYGINRIN